MWFTRVHGAYKARPEHGRLAAREKGQMKARTLFKTRGVRAAHGMHGVPGLRRRQVRTFERCDTHDRTVFAERSHYGTRTPSRLTTLTSGALTTSGSDHVKAAIF